MARLTRRQREVLAYLAQGLANKEIARRMGISLNTVKAHCAALYLRLDVRGREEAILAAMNEAPWR